MFFTFSTTLKAGTHLIFAQIFAQIHSLDASTIVEQVSLSEFTDLIENLGVYDGEKH